MILLYNLYPLTWAFFCPISHYIFWFGCYVRHLGSFPIEIHRSDSSIATAQLLTAGHPPPPLSLILFWGLCTFASQCVVVPKQEPLENGKLGSIQRHLAQKADFKLAECFTDEDEENGLCLKFVWMQKRFLRLLKEFLKFSSLHFGMLELWDNVCCFLAQTSYKLCWNLIWIILLVLFCVNVITLLRCLLNLKFNVKMNWIGHWHNKRSRRVVEWRI